MRNRYSKLDVPHPLPAHTGKCYLHAAPVTNHAFVFDSLVFTARTFPISSRAKNPLAEQPSLFRLESTVVDGFRILYLALAPGTDRVRRRHANCSLVKTDRALLSKDLAY